MGSNIDVAVTVEMASFTAGMALAKLKLADTQSALRQLATEMKGMAEPSEEVKTKLTELAYQAASAKGKVDLLSTGLKSATATMVKTALAAEGAAAPMESLTGAADHQAAIVREKLVLAHELLRGNYTRLGGSMMVLTEQTGSLAKAFGTLLSPTTLAIAAVVAFGASTVEAIRFAEKWDESLGQIKAAMDATGQGYQYNRDQIGSYIVKLRELPGVSTAAATEMVTAFARQRDIGVDSYEKLGDAAAGYARVTGMEVPKAADELVAALKGGYDGIDKLDEQFSFLSVAQAQAIHDFEASGEKAQAMQVAIEALGTKFGALVADGMTPLQKASNDMKVAWDDLLGSLSNTAPFEAAQGAIAKLMGGVSVSMRGLAIDLRGPATSADSLETLKTKRADLQSRRENVTKTGADPSLSMMLTQSETRDQAPSEEEDLNDIDQQIAKTDALIAAKERLKQQSDREGEGAPDAAAKELIVQREIQDENAKLMADDAERTRIAQELVRDTEALKTATAAQAPGIRDNIALLQRQQRELNNRVGAGQIQDLRDELEGELVQRKLIGDQEQQYELKYWQDHLAQVQSGSRAELEIRKEIANLEHDLSDKALAQERASQRQSLEEARKTLADEWENFSENMRLKIEASKANVGQQLALAQQWVEKGEALYGDDVKAYRAALDEKSRLFRQQVEDTRKIREIGLSSQAALARIDIAANPTPKGAQSKSLVEWMFGDIDGSGATAELDRRMNALKLEFQAKQAEYQDIIGDKDSTAVQVADAQGKLAETNAQFAADTADLNKEAASKVAAAWDGVFAPVEHAFTSSIEGMLQGTQTLDQGMKKLAQSVVLSLTESGIHEAFSSLSKELASLVAPTFGGAGAQSWLGSLFGIGGAAAGAGAGVGTGAAQTTALTANTAALTSLTATMAGHATVVAANTAGTATNTATQTTGLIGNTVQTDVNSSALAANTSAVGAGAASSGAGGFFSGLSHLIPFFDTGTDRVAADTLAMVHKDEIIIPAAKAAGIRSGDNLFGLAGNMQMVLPTAAADTMRMLSSGALPGTVTNNSRSAGDVNLHYAPTVTSGGNATLETMLSREGTAMRRWIRNEMRNGAFRSA